MVALVVSIGAGAAAIVTLILQFRESGRRKEELRLLRDEDERRDRELQLLAQQVETQQSEQRRQERAKLEVFAGVQAEGSGRAIEYIVPVQNTGESGASQIYVELVDGRGITVGRGGPIPALVPVAKTYTSVLTPPQDRYTGPYEIFFEWVDGRGQMRASTGVQVGAPS